MAEEYTPTEAQVRQLYANSMDPAGFDRWLAEVRREVAEKAWDEGFADGYRQHAEGEDGLRFTNPYRKEQS